MTKHRSILRILSLSLFVALPPILTWTPLGATKSRPCAWITRTQTVALRRAEGPDTVSWWFLKQRLGLPMVR